VEEVKGLCPEPLGSKAAEDAEMQARCRSRAPAVTGGKYLAGLAGKQPLAPCAKILDHTERE